MTAFFCPFAKNTLESPVRGRKWVQKKKRCRMAVVRLSTFLLTMRVHKAMQF